MNSRTPARRNICGAHTHRRTSSVHGGHAPSWHVCQARAECPQGRGRSHGAVQSGAAVPHRKGAGMRVRPQGHDIGTRTITGQGLQCPA